VRVLNLRNPEVETGKTSLAANRQELYYATILSFALTALLWVRTSELTVRSPGFGLVGDDHVYQFMAMRLVGGFHVAPWSWRILVPGLARYLPFGIQGNFEFIAFTAVTLTAVFLFLILRKWGFGRPLAFVGILLYFAMSYVTKFNLRDFWLTDSSAFLFTAAGIYALQCRRLVIFAACAAVGLLAKESVIFIVPLCYTFTATRIWDVRAVRRTVVVALPAVLTLVLLRYAIPAWNGQESYITSLPDAVRADIGNVQTYNLVAVAQKELAARSHVWVQDVVDILTSFGALSIFLTLAARSALRDLLVKFWPFLLLVASQLIFTYNTQRLIALAFIPVTIACLFGVQAITEHYRMRVSLFAVAAVAGIGLELASPTASSPSPVLQLTVYGTLAAAVLAWRGWLAAGIGQESLRYGDDRRDQAGTDIHLESGDAAPDFTLSDADGREVMLSSLRGQRVIIYFYPAAMTPDCTKQACDFRDSKQDLSDAGYTVLGISPDGPVKLAKFRDRDGLTFPLLSDPDKAVLKTYGAFREKVLRGKTPIGVIRSTVVIDADQKIERAYYAVKATGHVARLRKDLGA
jgi:peroxiredoxin Q/BCP